MILLLLLLLNELTSFNFLSSHAFGKLFFVIVKYLFAFLSFAANFFHGVDNLLPALVANEQGERHVFVVFLLHLAFSQLLEELKDCSSWSQVLFLFPSYDPIF